MKNAITFNLLRFFSHHFDFVMFVPLNFVHLCTFYISLIHAFHLNIDGKLNCCCAEMKFLTESVENSIVYNHLGRIFLIDEPFKTCFYLLV